MSAISIVEQAMGVESAIYVIVMVFLTVWIFMRSRQVPVLIRVDPPLPKRGPFAFRSLRIESRVPLSVKDALRHFTEPELLETWICCAWHGVSCEFDATNNSMSIVDGQDHGFVWQFVSSTPTGLKIRQLWTNESPIEISVDLSSEEHSTIIQVTLEGTLDDVLEEEYKADWCALAKLGQPLK